MMTQPSNVVDLAVERARRKRRASERAAAKAATLATAQVQAQAGRWADALVEPLPTPPAAKVAPASPPLIWRESKRGNWWTKDPSSRFHVVIYETSRGWSGRATPAAGEGFYVDVPPTVSSLAAAQAWAEGWLADT